MERIRPARERIRHTELKEARAYADWADAPEYARLVDFFEKRRDSVGRAGSEREMTFDMGRLAAYREIVSELKDRKAAALEALSHEGEAS